MKHSAVCLRMTERQTLDSREGMVVADTALVPWMIRTRCQVPRAPGSPPPTTSYTVPMQIPKAAPPTLRPR